MPLTEAEEKSFREMHGNWPRVLEILTEWPRVKGAAERETFVEWYTGVLKRNPKLSGALHTVVGMAGMALTAWLTWLMPVAQKPPPEAAPVIAPVEVSPAPVEKPNPKPAPKSVQKPKPMPPAAVKQTSSPVSSPESPAASRPVTPFAARLRAAYDTEPAEDKEILHHLRDIYAHVLSRMDEFKTGAHARESAEALAKLMDSRFVHVRAAISVEMAAALPTETLDDASRAKAVEVMSRIVGALDAILGDGKASEPAAIQANDGWTVYRSLPVPSWADGPKKSASLNAAERKVR